MKEIFDQVSIRCSQVTTRAYSTSFSLGIRCLAAELRDPVYAIYGFVRFADEIVDSFHAFDKQALLRQFKEDTYKAIAGGISLNPILNSFQHTVHRFKIDPSLIELFLQSMEMDLSRIKYDRETFEEYVLGSAQVVGLMCLKVFCKGDRSMFENLKPYAMNLAAAFQQINFLRDIHADYIGLGRIYFPGVEMTSFDEACKQKIEAGIRLNFEEGLKGIRKLPRSSRLGVYVAYVYYQALFKKIMNTPSEMVLKRRISIHNREKARLLAYSFVKHQLHLI